MGIPVVILSILATIIVAAIIVGFWKTKIPENKGGDTEPGQGDLGTGNGKNK